MMRKLAELTGMRVFFIIWTGQFVSLLGSSLTSFALGIWTYQETGEVTQFAFVLFSSTLPPVLLATFAGTLADKWDRRWVIILSDLGSAVSTLAVLLLLLTNQLEAWHIYLATAFSAIMGTIQGPAGAAIVPLLVPEQHLGRANGMAQISRSAGQLIAPILGGFLLLAIGLEGIILIDLISFLFAVGTMLSIRLPQIPRSTTGDPAKETWLQASLAGWKYIIERPGLLSLLLYFASINFLLGSIEVLVTPLALSITTPEMLGVLLFVGGLGMLAGSVVLSVWGGPKRKIYAVLIPQFIGGLCVLIVGLSVNVIVLGVAAFIYFFGVPICDGCTGVIFQQKVAIDVQGRVFAVIGAIASFILPISYLIVSSLADQVFEPMMMPGGALAGTFGPLFGVGEGRGIGLLFALMGILAMVATLLAYLYQPLRSIEKDLPSVNIVLAPIDTRSANQTPG